MIKTKELPWFQSQTNKTDMCYLLHPLPLLHIAGVHT